jgi:hypothetical protein
MSLEAARIAEAQEGPASEGDRRGSTDRRGKDRRRTGSRINRQAPRRSLMKLLGAGATAVSIAVFALALLAHHLLDVDVQVVAIAGGLTFVAAFALMLGSIEQRLIEVRLELMMLNGGDRRGDRRQSDRRA